MRLEHSRALRLAAGAAGEPESVLEARLRDARLCVSVEPAVPGAREVGALLVETLRRGPGVLHLDPTGLIEKDVDVMIHAASTVSEEPIIVGADDGAIRIHVGRQAAPGIICVLADGYGARLRTTGEPLDQQRAPTSLGVMLAASLAAGEAFKHTAGLRPPRCVFHEDIAFCPVTLSDDLAAAPMLKDVPSLQLGLVGQGAVGTAETRIISGLPLRGCALAVDPQTYAVENVGTYSLGGLDDAQALQPKVELTARTLARFAVTSIVGTIEQAIPQIDRREVAWPTLTLTALDSVEARHAAQGIWPKRLIDAATGDTFVGLHDVEPDGPCLRCLLPQRPAMHSAAAQLAEDLGLPLELVMHGDRLLEARDLEAVTAETRARLLPHLGKPICGLASGVGLTGEEDESYRPSAPFVSQQAACLGAGRLVAVVLGLTRLPNFVQYDALIGPQAMTQLTRRARGDCYCQQRRPTIVALRLARAAS